MIEVGINVFNVYINKARGVGMAWGGPTTVSCHKVQWHKHRRVTLDAESRMRLEAKKVFMMGKSCQVHLRQPRILSTSIYER